jgi:putative sterol carrier protein
VGLKLLFGALARRFDPVAAEGFAGEVQWDLRTRDDRVKQWTLAVAGGSAAARRRPATAPVLIVRLGLADLLRLAVGELDAGRALLDGRLDLEGDFAVATRLGPMFGLASPV